ncbi:YesL family protein [Clostridium cellulovorans]|uniref:Uncharacterized protein n=1 Tax=Clostridium cellulovorans (strain ATCC 35296 / DSM 3052 / OCM 3 / 743B) TaxID=573061 RepID=D9SMM8_CLOC7|nr:DUF624 domain-containing protein [Clostridium cellulovorans]ADL49813.1 protein of unknown function DUF624 [Clostridium cellulovorans 743B]
MRSKASREEQKQFGDNIFTTIMNYVYWFLAGSGLFIISNILFIACMFFVLTTAALGYQIDIISALILLLSAISLGPSITALMGTMGKLVREQDVKIFSEYIRSYKLNFKQSISLWAIQLLVIGILVIDYKIFISTSYGRFLIPAVFIIIFLLVNMYIYMFSLMSRFFYKSRDLIKISFFYTISKVKNTAINSVIVIVATILIFQYSNIVLFFIPAVMIYGIMFNQKSLFESIENKIDEKKSTF